MNGLVTPARLDRVFDLPLYFAATELKRSRSIHIGEIPLTSGQKLVLRTLTLHVVKALTPSVLPVLVNSALGQVSVGLYFGDMLTGALAVAKLDGAGAAIINPFIRHVFVTPGVYDVVVSNNTSNSDFSVVVTGALKYYL